MYKTKYILILSLFLLLFACDNLDISSNQSKTFIKLFGSWNRDVGQDVKEFNDAFLILATGTSNNDNTEIVLLQTNKFGNLLNNGIDTLSSIRGGDNTASKLLLTNDGGFIVLGTVEDTSKNKTDIYINKFNSAIESEWEKFLGSDNLSNEEGASIKKAVEGYVIAGNTDKEGSKDIYLVKIDDAGNEEWTVEYGWSEDDYLSEILIVNERYLAVGTTNSLPSSGKDLNNILLIEINNNGSTTEIATYGDLNNNFGSSIVNIDDGGYLILGTSFNSAGNSSGIYTVKTEDNIYNIQNTWPKEYATDALAQGTDIIKSNEGFVIVGTKELTSGVAACFLKIDNDGEIVAENSYGGYGQKFYSIEKTSDGGYILIGSSGVEGNEMICLMKVNSEGEL